MGDIKNVSDGHARNFLFPRKLARIADDGAMKEMDKLKAQRQAAGEKEVAQANAAAEKIKTITLEIKKKASPTGTLFSSVTKDEVAKDLSRLSGFKIDKDMVDLGEHGEHVKHLGEHMVAIHLNPNLRTELKLKIVQ